MLKKVRRLAEERGTTLTALVRAHLLRLAAREDARTEEIMAKLKASFDTPGVIVDRKQWAREDLHAR